MGSFGAPLPGTVHALTDGVSEFEPLTAPQGSCLGLINVAPEDGYKEGTR